MLTQLLVDEALDEVVAVVVAGVAMQFEGLAGARTGRLETLALALFGQQLMD